MIYFGATSFACAEYDGRWGQAASTDDCVILQGTDPLALEARINAEGLRQSGSFGRSLGGYQIAVGGKGNVCTVILMFDRTAVSGIVNATFVGPSVSGAGISAYLYKATAEHEFIVQQRAAIRRAQAWIGAAGSGNNWFGYEVAGGSCGGEQWGLIVMQKGAG